MVNIKKYYNDNSVQLRRLIAATATLAIFFLILILYGQSQTLAQEVEVYKSLDAEYGQSVENLPLNFENEIVTLQDFCALEINVNDTKNVIGFVCNGSANDTACKIKQQMEDHG